MAKKQLSNSQMVCIALLWVLVCYIILVYSKVIDWQVIASILFSGAFVFIPIYKTLRRRRN